MTDEATVTEQVHSPESREPGTQAHKREKCKDTKRKTHKRQETPGDLARDSLQMNTSKTLKFLKLRQEVLISVSINTDLIQ